MAKIFVSLDIKRNTDSLKYPYENTIIFLEELS